jgi:hypothetical protein
MRTPEEFEASAGGDGVEGIWSDRYDSAGSVCCGDPVGETGGNKTAHATTELNGIRERRRRRGRRGEGGSGGIEGKGGRGEAEATCNTAD